MLLMAGWSGPAGSVRHVTSDDDIIVRASEVTHRANHASFYFFTLTRADDQKALLLLAGRLQLDWTSVSK